MQDSTIDSKLIYNLLKRKGVNNFYHANTVKTSLTFIKEKALLSREYVESRGFIQTDQYTDSNDKKLGIWDSVFLDGTDLHKKFTTRNRYGPILFHISLDIFLNPAFKTIRITKSNPDSWSSVENKFYTSVEEIDKDYLTGDKLKDGRIMFLFDFPEKAISLGEYCNRIIIDDPKITLEYAGKDKRAIFEMVKLTIESALKESDLTQIQIGVRHMDGELCSCYSQYKNMFTYNKDSFNKLFKK